jgi:hypothetical protein
MKCGSRPRGGQYHPTETWQHLDRLDILTPEESIARHGRMMTVIAKRIEDIRVRLGGRSSYEPATVPDGCDPQGR